MGCVSLQNVYNLGTVISLSLSDINICLVWQDYIPTGLDNFSANQAVDGSVVN